MKIWQQVLLLLVLSVGCTHTYTATSLDEINEAVLDKEVTIRLNDDSVFTGNRFRVAADSARWLDNDGNARIVPSHSIAQIEVKNRMKGMKDGFLVGAIGCATFSAAISGQEKGTTSGMNFDFTKLPRGEAAAIGGGFGGVLGCTLGCLNKSTDQYTAPDSLLQSE